MQGRVRWLAGDGRLYGFIIPVDDAGGQDAFFHKGDLIGSSFDELGVGTLVEYETVMGSKGPRAIAVKVIDEEHT